MPTTDFSKMLEIGLGRAVLYAQQHDMTGYRDVILNACLHCQSWDTQIEGSRAVFMWDVIHATSDVPFYRDHILAALAAFDVSTVPESLNNGRDFVAEHNLQQLLVFASNFAEEGINEARQIMYAKFNENTSYGDYMVAGYIVQLDGIAGFEYVIRRIGIELIEQDDPYHLNSLFFDLEEAVGEEEAKKELDRLFANPDWIALAEQIRANEERIASRKNEPAPYQHIPYSELKKSNLKGDTARWGTNADAAELLEAAQDLLLQTDLQRLTDYIGIFRKTPFPLEPTRLLDLVREIRIQKAPFDNMEEHRQGRMVAYLFTALENVQNDSVRQFALDNIGQGFEVGRSAGILLAQNYIEGDWQFIENLSASPFDDREDYHSLEWSVRHAWDHRVSYQAVGTLFNFYEYGPCGTCRGKFVEYLHSLGKLPEWMIPECRYDAYDETREFIETTFGTPNETSD